MTKKILLPITTKKLDSLPKELKAFVSDIPYTDKPNAVNLQTKTIKARVMLLSCIHPTQWIETLTAGSKKKNQK